jgi:FtsP/CotA-like multicopper oxidase with cupredoxin domain
MDKPHGNKEDYDSKIIQRHIYQIDIREFKQQILPEGFPLTTVWGYGGLIKDPETGCTRYSISYPGATFEARRNIPVTVKWNNCLKNPSLFAVDPTLHWANPNDMPMDPPKPWPLFPPGFKDAQQPVPTVTHLHGGEVSSIYDGHPEAWYTVNGKTGSKYVTDWFTYPNSQEAATLWYHDHALGVTRLNVYAGLSGFYLLRTWPRKRKCNPLGNRYILPHGSYEIPIVIQDRSFLEDGSLLFNNEGDNPEVHPYWMPEFFGDTIVVNGKVWPNLDVKLRQYRFRLLNGSNARFYNLKLTEGLKMVQIGSDGGFLPHPVVLDSLLLAPAERADILIDFSGLTPGTKVLLLNDANTPYPDGTAPDSETTGQIMQFSIPLNIPAPEKPAKLPACLNKIPALIPDSPKRILTLYEVGGPNGPLEVLLDGQTWSAPITEVPLTGSTEEWEIVNLTQDTHPIHLHLIQFQLLNRQSMNAGSYTSEWLNVNGTPPLDHPTRIVEIGPYLCGKPLPPDPNETGWKDTIRMNPGQVTRILVRFAPQDIPAKASRPGLNLFPFDPSYGPGYVWHCHIIDHEDNEMMRPYKVRRK